MQLTLPGCERASGAGAAEVLAPHSHRHLPELGPQRSPLET